jgi:hypothetical protein
MQSVSEVYSRNLWARSLKTEFYTLACAILRTSNPVQWDVVQMVKAAIRGPGMLNAKQLFIYRKTIAELELELD